MDRRQVLAAAAAAVLGADQSDAAEPAAPQAVIVVNDLEALGSGAERLSLAMAMRIANGAVSRSELSRGQRALVQGAPANTGPVEIRFDLPSGSVVNVPRPATGTRECLPMITRAGVSIVGSGVILRQAPAVADEKPGTAFLVSASGVTIRGFTLEGFRWGVEVIGSLARAPIENIVVTDNDITGPAAETYAAGDIQNQRGGIILIGAEGASGGAVQGGVVRNVLIEGNTIKYDINSTCIGVYGAQSNGPFQASNGAVENVTVVNNDIVGGVSCFYMSGGQAMFGGSANASVARRVNLIGNRMSECADVSIFIPVGAAVPRAVATDDNIVEDVVIASNRIDGYACFLAGDVELGQGGAANRNTLRRLAMHSNQVRAAPMRGLWVTAGNQFATSENVRVTDNRIEDLSIRDNAFFGCSLGLRGAGGGITSGVFSGNVLARVEVVDNTFTDIAPIPVLNPNGEGITVHAAATQALNFGAAQEGADNSSQSEDSDRLGMNYLMQPSVVAPPLPTELTNNRVEDLLIDRNVFSNNTLAIGIYGVESNIARDVFRDNAIERIMIGQSNRFVETDGAARIETVITNNVGQASNTNVTQGAPSAPRLNS